MQATAAGMPPVRAEGSIGKRVRRARQKQDREGLTPVATEVGMGEGGREGGGRA